LAGGNRYGYDALRRAARSGDPRTYWLAQRDFLGDARHRDAVSPSLLARCYVQLGEMDSALVLLQRALEQHDSNVHDLVRESALAPLRSDPRGMALLRKYGFER
jgi:hypothetical protein